jgi:DNA ligase-1
MRKFASLYATLDGTNKTSVKIQALIKYFTETPAQDAVWAIYFLIGRKPRQIVASAKMRAWAAEAAGIPHWLFQESYDAVGDVAETIALLLPPPARSSDISLSHWIEQRLLPLRAQSELKQQTAMIEAWHELQPTERLVWNKLISGGFRVGVSQQLVTRALAEAAGVTPGVLAHRLMGNWEPTPSFFATLLAREPAETAVSQPYPFFLAYALDQPLEKLGERSGWQVEWKWDGIRCQLLRRGGETFLWSRGEELVTDRYPELAAVGDILPEGTVIDGEILPWRDEFALPFTVLQKRIGRKAVTRKILAEVPVIMMAFDLLEYDGSDVRAWPLGHRRAVLTKLVERFQHEFPSMAARLRLSPMVGLSNWAELTAAWSTSRDIHAEGFMLKRLNSGYAVGRHRGDWWKWKILPYTIDAVLIAAQRGSGKRASLYTDYTFGVWDNGALVPIAKAYSGLTNAEIQDVDKFIRQNMVERFGPVRTIKPELVFELAFEGLNRSSRHKSGIAVRFPRILRRRTDKRVDQADTLDSVRALLPPE